MTIFSELLDRHLNSTFSSLRYWKILQAYFLFSVFVFVDKIPDLKLLPLRFVVSLLIESKRRYLSVLTQKSFRPNAFKISLDVTNCVT